MRKPQLVRSSQTSSKTSLRPSFDEVDGDASKTTKTKNPIAQNSLSSLVDRFTSRRQQSFPRMNISPSSSSLANSTPPTSKENARRSFNFKNIFSSTKSVSNSSSKQSSPSTTSLLQRTSTIKFRKDNSSSTSPPTKKLSTLDEDNDQFDTISQASAGKLINMRKGNERPWRNFFTPDCRKLDLLYEKQFNTSPPSRLKDRPSDSCFTSSDDGIDDDDYADEITDYQSDNRVLTTPHRRRPINRMRSSRTLPRLNLLEENGALLASPSVPDYSTRALTTPRKLRGGVQKRWKRREQIHRRRSVNQTYIEATVLDPSSSTTQTQQQVLQKIGTSAIELRDNAQKNQRRLYSVAAGGGGGSGDVPFKYEKDKKNGSNIFGGILSLRNRKKMKENRSLGNIYPGYNNPNSTTNPSPNPVYPYKADVLT
uniref:Uncharacterized protein n=1 Tax=Panagrolaimus sp. PS1159 TaxID=55785 RepID=A0AC35FYJ5_9BILA